MNWWLFIFIAVPLLFVLFGVTMCIAGIRMDIREEEERWRRLEENRDD